MAAKRESKLAYLDRRKKRVRELYLEGEETVDIASKLVTEGVIETSDESLESAIRLVRKDIAKFRAELAAHRIADAKPEIAGDDIDILSRKLKRLREEHAFQCLVRDGQPMELCARSSIPASVCANKECEATGKHATYVGPGVGITIAQTPQGPITTYKALWPAGVRQKAGKDAATLAVKISEVETALAAKRAAVIETGTGAGDQGGLTIVESEKSIPELIEANLSVN